ncbi:MAG: ABC transporter permease [Desulfobacterales bacterium]
MNSYGNGKYGRSLQIIFRASLFLLLMGIWEILAATGLLNPFYSSQPSRILMDLPTFFKSGGLLKHTGVTLSEALWGLLFGTLAGIAAAFFLGLFDFVGKVIEPFITALYGIPKLALAPIFVLWFGLGIESKVILSGLLVFFLVFFSTFGGIKSVDRNILISVRLMGATRLQIIRKVILPSCVPWILAGVRGGLGASLIGAIVGEYMGASAGLGWVISSATSFFQVDRVMSCIFILFLIGILFNMGLKHLEKRLLRWRPPLDYSGTL